MFCNIYFVKNLIIAKSSITTKARKNKYRFGIITFFYVCLTEFRNNQILLNKISHRFLLMTKLLTGQQSLTEGFKLINWRNLIFLFSARKKVILWNRNFNFNFEVCTMILSITAFLHNRLSISNKDDFPTWLCWPNVLQ